MIIEENGVRVSVPDDNYFQFGKCDAYIAINGQDVKEMDVCWYETGTDTLWLVELKAFDNPANVKYQQQDLNNPQIVEYWLSELEKKTIHAVCMSTINRSQTQSCMTQIPTNSTKIKVVHLLKVIPGQDSYLNPMQDMLRAKLRPYSAIFNISGISVISYDYAVQRNLLNWII
jgi:hypothetical protein